MLERDAADTAALVALQRLQAAYGDAVTRRAWDEVAALFEPDAVVHLDLRDRGTVVLRGPEALVGFVTEALDAFSSFELAVLNTVVEVGGDEGWGRMYLCEHRHHRDGTWSQAYGLYQDRYHRRDGRWRVAERRYASLARVTPAGAESWPLPPTEPLRG